MPPARRLLPDPVHPRPGSVRHYAYTRSAKIMSEDYLVAQGRHARREDGTGAARVREDAVAGTSLGWSFLDGPQPTPRPVHDSCYDGAHRAFLQAHAARVRKNGPLGLHLIVNVSAAWIEQGGDLHDPTNPRIRAHWDAVVTWARDAFGEALFALRIDLDETGAGVADAFLAPLRRLGHKAKTAAGRLWVSVNRAMEELTTRFGHRKSENWHAINTAWAAHAREHLDPRLERGTPKRLTRRRNLSPDLVRAMHERLDAREAEIRQQERRAGNVERALDNVLQAVLAGRRMTVTAEGYLVLRPCLPEPGEVGRAPGEDDHQLRSDLWFLWPDYAAAIRAAVTFSERITMRLARSHEAIDIGAYAWLDRQAGDALEENEEPDDPFRLDDPFDMTLRLR